MTHPFLHGPILHASTCSRTPSIWIIWVVKLLIKSFLTPASFNKVAPLPSLWLTKQTSLFATKQIVFLAPLMVPNSLAHAPHETNELSVGSNIQTLWSVGESQSYRTLWLSNQDLESKGSCYSWLKCIGLRLGERISYSYQFSASDCFWLYTRNVCLQSPGVHCFNIYS